MSLELSPLVTSINKLDVNNTANDVGEWYINEELDLTYFSVVSSDSVPSDTITDVGDDLVGNRCPDIITCTGEIIFHGISRRQ